MYAIHVQIISDVRKYKHLLSDTFKTSVLNRSFSDMYARVLLPKSSLPVLMLEVLLQYKKASLPVTYPLAHGQPVFAFPRFGERKCGIKSVLKLRMGCTGGVQLGLDDLTTVFS